MRPITSPTEPVLLGSWFMLCLLAMQIDHDPNEPPPDRSGTTVYWAAFALLAVMWALALYSGRVDYGSAVIGAATGLAFGIWGMAVTGGRLPPWWPR